MSRDAFSSNELPLSGQGNKEVKLDWRVEAMTLSKDWASLFYSKFLTLDGTPRETFEYRLGNRSAVEWMIDQYHIEHRQTQRHHQRRQPPRRPRVHPPPPWPSHHREFETVKVLKGLR